MSRAEGVVWITGASSGIGLALALRMARGGRHVIASARNVEAIERAASAESLPLVAFALDITDRAAVDRAVARIEREHGAIALAVLNAGTHRPMSAGDFDPEGFRALVDVNLMGTVHCLAAILAAMRPRGTGHIAIVSSVAGYRGLPTAAAYGATKAALINMAEALKPECDAIGIRLQLINPGFVATPLTARNDFPMPFIMPVERAVDRLIAGLAGDRFEIVFPRRFALLLKIMRCLPYPAYFRLVRAVTRS